MTIPPRSSLAQRLSFYRIDAKDEGFAQLSAALDRFGKAGLDHFYENVLATPETARFFGDRKAVDRAHAAQTRHWKSIFTHGLNEDYVASTKRIGDVHAKIGLEPKWYIGGYANIGHFTTQQGIEAGMRIVERIRASEKPVLSEEAGFSIVANREVISNPTQLRNL